ncbi:MAG TPA: DUF6600 domain-containing protein [Candidatus Binatia bacterium]|jgi:hypothetical protein
MKSVRPFGRSFFRPCVRPCASAAIFLAALTLCAVSSLALPQRAAAYYEVDESVFRDALSSQGTWVQTADFGWAWYPAYRPAGWRPYTLGHWAWTDDGQWLWVSDEPFGWATYHYGRWYLDPAYGWIWIPGNVWAPAWVDWRECDDFIGWAPLGPWVYWDGGSWHHDRWHDGDHHDHDGDHHDHGGDHHDHGGDRRHDSHAETAAFDQRRAEEQDRNYWNFAHKRDFTSTRVDRVLVDRTHVGDVYGRSRELAPDQTGHHFSRGIDPRTIEHATGHRITPVRIEDRNSPPAGAHGRGAPDEASHGRVRLFRPDVHGSPDATAHDHEGRGELMKPSFDERHGNIEKPTFDERPGERVGPRGGAVETRQREESHGHTRGEAGRAGGEAGGAGGEAGRAGGEAGRASGAEGTVSEPRGGVGNPHHAGGPDSVGGHGHVSPPVRAVTPPAHSSAPGSAIEGGASHGVAAHDSGGVHRPVPVMHGSGVKSGGYVSSGALAPPIGGGGGGPMGSVGSGLNSTFGRVGGAMGGGHR